VAGIIGIVVVIAACIFIASLFFRTDDVNGRVADVEWIRTVAIEAIVPVERSAFIDEIPAEIEVYDCRQELHHVQDNPDPNAQKVCGTPYTVDTGTGIGEVVQDCQYEVYEDYCSFTVDEWRQVNTVTERGHNLAPFWPQPQLNADQRLGSEQEQFEIVFEADGERLQLYEQEATPEEPGVEIEGTRRRGFPTPSRLLEIYSQTLTDWGWGEHALPGAIGSWSSNAGAVG